MKLKELGRQLIFSENQKSLLECHDFIHVNHYLTSTIKTVKLSFQCCFENNDKSIQGFNWKKSLCYSVLYLLP